jgi:hypothetical protein
MLLLAGSPAISLWQNAAPFFPLISTRVLLITQCEALQLHFRSPLLVCRLLWRDKAALLVALSVGLSPSLERRRRFVGCSVPFYPERRQFFCRFVDCSFDNRLLCCFRFVAFYQETSLCCLLYPLACNLHWRQVAALAVVAISFAQSVASSTSSLVKRSCRLLFQLACSLCWTEETALSVALSLSLESCLLLCRRLLSAKGSRFAGRFSVFSPEITPRSRLLCRLSRYDAGWLPLCRLLRRLL